MREIKFLPFTHVVAESPRSFSGSKPLEFSDGNCNQSEGRQLDSFRQFSWLTVSPLTVNTVKKGSEVTPYTPRNT